jgi:hypothetical protein
MTQVVQFWAFLQKFLSSLTPGRASQNFSAILSLQAELRFGGTLIQKNCSDLQDAGH